MEDESDEQYAYQTAVNIRGHVFRGILYDQGPDHHHNYQYTTSATAAVIAGLQPLGLTAASSDLPAGAASGGGGAMVSSSGGLVDPLYPSPTLNSFMDAGTSSGTQFFPHHPRSS